MSRSQSHMPAPGPSIPSDPTPGKDPPDTDTGAMEVRGSSQEREKEGEQKMVEDDQMAMPPPPRPRRTSLLESASTTPQSPGILLTHPTFPPSSSSASVSASTSAHPQAQLPSTSSNTEGLASTEGTIKGLGLGLTLTPTQRPPFSPFFCLVNEVEGGSGSGATTKTFHPAQVHYLFADDEENGLLTEALVRCVDRTGVDPSREGRTQKGKGKARKERGREERVVIVDVNETGDGIKSVWSANPNWAVLGAEIGNAPTWDGAEGGGEHGEEEGARGLMLRIEGISTSEGAAGLSSGGGAGDLTMDEGKGTRNADGGSNNILASGVMGDEEMQGLLDGFDRKMALLRRIVASGEDYLRVKTAATTTTEPARDSHREL